MPALLTAVSPYTGRAMGAFRATLITGSTTGMAANAAIASLRWTDTQHQAVITSVSVAAAVTTAFTTAQTVDAEAIIARSFTVADSSGTAVTLTGVQKLSRDQQDSLVADLRVSAAAALTAGTRTLDSVGIAAGVIPQTNNLGGGASIPIMDATPTAAPLCVLSANEGLIVRVPTAQGAVGVVKYYVTIAWREVPTGVV